MKCIYLLLNDVQINDDRKCSNFFICFEFENIYIYILKYYVFMHIYIYILYKYVIIKM